VPRANCHRSNGQTPDLRPGGLEELPRTCDRLRPAKPYRWCAIILTIANCVLAGCAGYKVGPTNGIAAGSRSVQVNPFMNKVLEEPRLSEAVTESLRKRLQQDGTFQLDTHGEGDIVVTGVVSQYHRTHLSFQPRDILTPRDYRVVIWADVQARDRISGKTLLERRVPGHTTLRVGSDLTSSERQALPLAAEDLARNITALLVDGEW
jgi:lipopolysaccharide assembly LptE-like protein